MDNREKLAMLEEILEMDEGELSPEAVLDDIDNWDSMSKLSLIVLVEEEFGKILKSVTIRNFKTAADILTEMS